MKKILKVIRNILIGIIMVVYFAFIVAISTLLLNKNDYGVTQFGEKSLILVDDKISNKDYPEGTLVILETRKIEDLKAGEEVFIYQPDNKDKSVDIIISDIESVHLDVDSPYVKLANDGTAWGEDFIAGTKVEVYPDLGSFLIFIESKWVFFILLIMPCFFILLYEIYLLIIAIKFDDDDEEEVKAEVKNDSSDSSDKLEDLAKQLEALKKEAGEEEPKAKEENIDDLMAQLNSLRKEYDNIGDSSEDKNEIIEIEKDEVQEAIEQSITEAIPVVTEKVIELIEDEKVETSSKEVEKQVQPNNSNKQNNNNRNNQNNRNNNNRNNNNRNNQNNRNNNRNNNNRNNQNNRNNNRNNNNRNNQNNRNNNRNNNNRNNQKRK